MTRDIPRYLLIAAIAVLSFMLLTEWVHFREKQMAATDVTAVTADANPAKSGDAIPSVAPATNGAALGDNANAPTARDQLIHVHTDVLDVEIDPHGGDIVYAALPKYSKSLDTPNVPFVILERDHNRTYTAQSGLVGRNGTDSAAGRPLYQANATSYRLAPGKDDLAVELTYETPDHVQIRKRFLFTRGEYTITVNYRIDNRSNAAWQAAMFGQLKRDQSADPSIAKGHFGVHSYLGAAAPVGDTTYEKLPFKDFKKDPLNEKRTGGWIGIVQHYFLGAWVPDQKSTNRLSTLETAKNMNIVRFTSPTQDIPAGDSGEFSARLYVGPKDQNVLRHIAPGMELSVDYGWLWMIAQPIFYVLTKIHAVVGNWGWSIVIITMLIKIMFFWLNAKAYTSMANMRKVQPKLKEIRERFADDRQKQSQEMMKLYKTEKINPLGGCLPMVVQMPVFLSLYWVLQESVELRHAPWIFWIKDLSAMDPYLILPLLMGVSMFVQQKLNPTPPDPMQAKVMQWMPIAFTFFFLWFPAGLVLYWVVNNTLSILQQYIITRRITKTS